MAAIVSGNGLGLFTSSLGVLGAGVGNAGIGRAGEGTYVNAATGNLIVQRQDEVLFGRGPDLSLVRTYNSQGQLTDDNGDNWLLGIQKRVTNLTGTINTAGSTVTRSNGDGAELVYSYDAVRGLYVNKDGAGSFDTLSYNAGVWTWTDGSSQLKESYDWTAGAGKLLSITDADGNALTYSYTGNLLTLVTDASGEQTCLDYSGNNLTQIRTVRADSTQLTRTRYGYDSSNRLTSVTVDLTPDDNSIVDGKTYVTSYTYDGTSRRIATITQTDGSQVAFTYATQTDGSVRVTQVDQTVAGSHRITYLAYDLANRKTTVTDPAGNATLYTYDTQGRLLQLQGPAVAGVSQLISYAYDADGNVTQQTDALGNTVTSSFDANGNMVLQRDALGNTVTRTYDSKNNLLTQTTYLTPDPDGAGSAQPSAPQTSRFAYDANGHLRFTVSAAGRVTEYRYNAQGQLVTSVSYPANAYNLTGLTATDTLAEAALTAWAAGLDQTGTTRSDMTYDFRGQVATTTNYAKVDASGAGISDGSQATTAYVYDQAGQLLKTVAPKGVATTGNATDFVTTYSYDGLGRMLSTTDSLNRTTVSQYDDAGNKTITTLANGLATTSAYNHAGELISVIQSDGATALGETKYWYDADGRVRMTQDPTGVKSYCLYDAAGRKIAAIDGNGSLVEYIYNANNQLISSKAYATAVSAANLAALIDGAGNPSNVTLASIRPATNSADRTSWNLYDAASRLVKTIDAEGYVSQNLYDGAGRVTDTVRYATAVNLAAITSATQASDAAATPAASAQDRHSRTFYDADGKAVAALDAAGYLTESQYDAAGRLIHTIGYATQTSSALWSNGTLTQLRPATTSQDTHGWVLRDGRGNVIATVNAEGYLTESIYDANGNQTQHIAYANKALIAPELITASTQIGSLRPASSSQDQVTSSTYTDINQVDTSTNVQGSVTRYTYDNVGNLIQTDKAFATAEVRTLQARYDRQGRVTGELTAEGSAALAALTSPTQAQIDAIWTSYGVTHTYDAAGRRTSTTDATGSKTLFYYNVDGQLTTTINALGEVKQSLYNALNELAQTVVYGTRIGSTVLATLTGGLENTTLAAAVNTLSNILSDSKTSVAYDHLGQAVSSTDALGNVSSVTYNAFGQALSATTQVAAGSTVTTQYQYDNRGLTTSTTQDAGGLNLITQALYDAFGRTTQTIDANGNVQSRQYDRLGRAAQSTDALNINRSTTYDAFDRTLTQTDGNGNVTTTSYNDANRSVTITTAEGIAVSTIKNRHGETVQVIDGNGNTTSYTYDKNGKLKSTTDALGHTTAASYDHAGRVIETTDANGVKTASSYDAASRLLTRTLDPGGLNLTTSYSYDAKGQTATVTDAAGVVTQTAYDAKGQVVSTTLDPSGLNLKTTYSYDARGKTLTVTEAAGSASQRTTQYTYDKLGRRTKEQIDPAGLNITTQYAYDANDNLVRKTDANGNVTSYFYDADNRLVYTLDALKGLTGNTYDAAGQIVKVTAYAAAAASLSGSSTLTAIGAWVAANGSSNDHIQQSVYDKDGRAVYRIDAQNHVTQNRYDANGNIIAVIAYANPVALPAGLTQVAMDAAVAAVADGVHDRVTRQVYDAANRGVYTIDPESFVKETQYDNAGQVHKTIQYARKVSLTGQPNAASVAAALVADAADQANTFAYDAAGRLLSGTDALGYSESYQYDAAGNKIGLTDKSGATWTYQYDANRRMVRETAPSVTVTRTSIVNGQPQLATASEAPITVLTYDALGNVKTRTEAYGTVEERTTGYVYDQVGRLIQTVLPSVPQQVASSIVKTGASGWDSDSYSVNSFTGGAFVSAMAGQTNMNGLFGLNADPASDASYVSLDYAWHFDVNGTLDIFENGVRPSPGYTGTYTATDVLSIVYTGSSVNYLKNGVVVRTVSTTAGRTFYFDSALYDSGFKLNAVRFESSLPPTLAARGSAVLTGTGNAATKTGAAGWDADVYSTNSFTGGALVSAMAGQTGLKGAFGLNADPATDAGYGSLDYAWHLDANGALGIDESGISAGQFGTYTATDVLSIVYDGANVSYLKNGVVIRTVATTAGRTFYFDSSLYDTGFKLNSIRFEPTAGTTPPQALVVRGSAALTGTGNGAIKTGAAAWDADVSSNYSFAGSAYVSAMAGQTNLEGMFGLNTDPATDTGYGSLDYAWYAGADGTVSIFESGAQVGNFGTYSTTDVLSIAYSGSNITYLKNGVVVRTVATTAGRTFYFDSSLCGTGFKLNDIRFEASLPPTLAARGGVALLGNAATKTGAAGWDADVYSTNSFTGGALVSATAGQTGLKGAFGLNADPATDAGYGSLDYAWHLDANGALGIDESGISAGQFGTYTTTDVLSIAYSGSSISYLKNGVVIRTVATTAGRTFYFDSSLYDTGFRLNSIRFEPTASTTPPQTLVVRGNAVLTGIGNGAIKTGPTEWDTDVYSSNSFTGSAIASAMAGQTNLGGMFGLNADPTTNASYTSLDYAWYMVGDGGLYIYENGAQIGNFGTYSTTDVLSVAYSGSTITYLKNGVVMRTVATTAGRTFYFDSSLCHTGFKLNDIRFESNPPPGLVTRGSVVLSGTGNGATKTGATGWDADVFSSNSFTGAAFVSATAGQTNMNGLFGLNADPTTDASYTSLDYAWHFDVNGTLDIFENGVRPSPGYTGTYTTTDVLAIAYDGTNVSYLKNGVVIRTVATTAGRTFYFDSSLYDSGFKLNSIRFEAAASITPPPAMVVRGNAALTGIGNGAIKTGAAAWDADVYSNYSFTGSAFASAMAGQTNLGGMFGLNADPTTDASYTSLDYAWYMVGDGGLYIYENGAQIGNFGTYSTTDVLSVAYSGSTITYLKNGVVMRTVATTAGRTFYFDSSLCHTGFKLNDIRFESNPPPGLVTRGSVALTGSGNGATKTGSAAWDADVYSNYSFTGSAFASAMAGQTNLEGMFGLNTDPATDAGYGSLDYAWYAGADGTVSIFESGAQIGNFGAYSTTDVLSIAYSGSSITYLKNGVVVRTVATTAGRTFYFDSSLCGTGFKLNSIRFEAAASITPPPALVVRGNAVLTGSGNGATKTGSAAWDADVYSTNSFTGSAFVSATAGQTNLEGMFGLNTDPATDAGYSSLDYAWYTGTNGTVSIYESGAQIGSFGAYSTTDVLSIAYSGSSINYLKNGVVMRTVATTAGRTFYFDSSLCGTGFKLNSIRFEAAASVTPPPALVVRGSAALTGTGNGAIKTGPTEWDADVYSTNSFTGSAIASAMAGQTNLGGMFGLNADPTTDASYTSLDYAWYMVGDGGLYIYENGVQIGNFGTYATTDVLSVAYSGSNINYLKNGVVMRTVATTAGRTFYFDSSLCHTGFKLNSIRFEPGSNISPPPGLIIRGNAVRTASGNGATKTGSAAWDADVYSTNSLTGSAMASATAGQTNLEGMFGLNADPATDTGWGSLDYAWYMGTNGTLSIYESGVSIGNFGAYATTDVLSVAYSGSSINYLKNGVVMRTVATTAGRTFYFDSSLCGTGFTLNNICFSANAGASLVVRGSASIAESRQVLVNPTSNTYYNLLGQAYASRSPNGKFSYKVYDSLGRVRYEIDAGRNVTEYTYNTFGERLTSRRYATPMTESFFSAREEAATDAAVQAPTLSEMQAFVAANASASSDRTVTNVYDNLGQVTETRQTAVDSLDTTLPAGNQSFTASPTTRNTYDSFGQVIQQSTLKNPLTNEWVSVYTAYDARGSKTAQVNALGYRTEWEYDAVGNVTRQTEYALPLTLVASTAPPLSLVARGSAALTGNSATKTGPTEWDADVYSTNSFTGSAFASAMAGQTNLSGMFGLNADPTTDASYTSLDYAWYMVGDGTLCIYESGVSVGNFGAYAATDILSVAYSGSAVSYLKNGVVMRTVATTAGRTFYFDSSLCHTGFKLSNIRFSSSASGGAVLSGTGNVSKTGPNGWDLDVYSTNYFTGGALASAVAGQTNLSGMFGLDSDPAIDAGYASLDYAWHTDVNGALGIYENGVNVGQFGTYKTTDVLSIVYDNANVRYLKNGAVIRTVATTAGRTFYFDSTLYSTGFKLNDIRFEPVANTAPPPSLVARGSAVLTGYSATKTGPIEWDADVYSSNSFTGSAFASAMAGQTNLGGMFGLNADPTTDASYTSLDYAWYMVGDGGLYIYENGVQIGGFGTYSTTDVLSVAYSGSNITYLKNGVVMRTVATTAGRTFYFDSSLCHTGFKLNDIRFESNPPPGLVTRGSVALTGTGNGAIKTGPTEWDADVYSNNSFTGSAIASAMAGQTNLGGMFGLNADPTTDASYTSLDYAWYMVGDGGLYIYESGAQIGNFGTYSTTDVLSVAYSGSTVSYLKNGVVMRTVATTAGRTFYFDSSLCHTGFKLNCIRFEPTASTTPPPALVVRGNAALTGIGNGAIKTGPTEWNADVYSSNSFTGNAIASAMAGQTNLGGMFGLNADPTTNASYTSLDYAWYMVGDGGLYIYENGVSVGNFGTYSTTDVLSVAYSGSTVSYLKNGVVMRTVATTAGRTFYFDSSLCHTGFKLNDIRFESNPPPGLVTRGSVALTGSGAIKTGSAAWDADVYSSNSFTGSAMASATAGQTNLEGMFGLNTDPATDAGYGSLDYAWYTGTDGTVSIFESGVSIGNFGAYSTTDVLSIAYSGSSINYLKNGVVMRTVATTAGRTFYFDSSLCGTGFTLNNIRFERDANASLAPGLFVRGATLTGAGDGAIKTGPAGWNSDVYSANSFTGSAYVSATAGQINMYGMFGLNADPASDASYASLDYAWYMTGDGTLGIYESGSYIGAYGPYATTDVLSVSYDGASISYIKNGTVIRTVDTTAGRTFYFDSSLYDPGFKLNNIWFSASSGGGKPALRDEDRVVRHVYDSAGRLVYAIDALGYVKETQYDPAGRISKTISHARPVSATVAPTVQDIASALNSGSGTSADRVNTFNYDSAGRLVSSVDAEGFVEQYGYDALGNKTSFTNKKGAVWTYDYDANSRLVAEHSPIVSIVKASENLNVSYESESLVTSMTYDVMGNVLSRTEAAGRADARTTYYQYDALGHQVRTIYPTTSIYNAAADNLASNGTTGHVSRTEQSVTLSSDVIYDALGNAVVSRDAAGSYSYKVYDQLGRVRYEIDAEQYVTSYQYDSFGHQVSLTRHANRISFGAHGNPASAFTVAEVAGLLGAPAAGDRTIQTRYNLLGQVIKVIEPQVYTYDSGATAGSQYFTAGRTTKNEYNAFGQLIKQSALRNATNNTWADTTFYYDARGNKIAQVDPLGYLTTWTYDAENNVIGQIEYARALPPGSWNTGGYGVPMVTVPQTSPDSAIGYDRETRFAYDRKNQKISQTQFNVEYADVSGALNVTKIYGNLTTALAYDAVGNLVETTDAAGNKTYMYYDAAGRNTALANSIGDGRFGLTTFWHDAFGDITRQTRWAGGASIANVNTYAIDGGSAANDQDSYNRYDNLGHLIQSFDADGKAKYKSYDAMGHVAKEWQPITDVDGLVQNAERIYRYDKLGQQLATVDVANLTNNNVGLANTPASLVQKSLTWSDTGTQIGTDDWGIPQFVQNWTLSWTSMAGWGDGAVRVEIDYLTPLVHVPAGEYTQEHWEGGQPASATYDYTAAEAQNGVTIANMPEPTAVRLYKKDAAGVWRQIQNTNHSGPTGTLITFAPPAQTGMNVSMLYRPVSGGAWTVAPLNFMGNKYVFDSSALPADTYYFEILYARPGEAAPSMHQTGQFAVSGVSGTLGNGETYVSAYTPPALDPAKTAVTQVQYNAFGEVVAKGVNGWQEYFDYDNAGHLWRSNGGDGIDVAYLYDLQGKATSNIRSPALDLHGYALQDILTFGSYLNRVDTVYDLKEQVVRQVQQSFSVNQGLEASSIPLAYPQAALSYSWTYTTQYGQDASGNSTQWEQPNLNVHWNSMSDWGPGEVLLEMDYYVAETSSPDVFGNWITYPAHIDTVSVTVPATQNYGVLPISDASQLRALRVSKKDVSGTFRLVHNTTGFGPYANLLVVPNPTEMGSGMQFRIKAAGGATWSTLSAVNLGNVGLFDTTGLGAGTYDYEVLYYHKDPSTNNPSSTPYSHATGQFSVNGGSGWLTQSTTATEFSTVTPVVSQTLDHWGNVLSVSNPRDASAITSYRYNYQNQVLQETKPIVKIDAANGTGAWSRPVTYAYFDKLGRQVATTDANGNINTVRYNAAGQVTTEYHADGGVVQYGYDVLGRRTSSTDGVGNVTSYTYDRLNRLKTQQRPIGADTYFYDEAGNRIRHIDANGQSELSWYDTRGKLIRTRAAMGQETLLYYDLRGNKIRETDANTDAVYSSYDYFGRLQWRTDLGTANYYYSYNEIGQLTHESNTRGRDISYTYYENGLVKTIVDNTNAEQTYYEYDAAGNRTRERFTKNGVTHQDNRITFDNLGRITFVQDNRYSLWYGYDANGNRRSAQSSYYDVGGSLRDVKNWYIYDSMNRILISQGSLVDNDHIAITGNQGVSLSYDKAGNRHSAFSVISGNYLTEIYAYDGNNRLSSVSKNGALDSWRVYDAVGRVTQQVTEAANPDSSKYRLTVNSYNANGWLTQQETFNGSAQIQSRTSYTAYDHIGNLKSYQTSVLSGFQYTNYYSIQYAKYDSYKQTVVNGSSTYYQLGATTSSYDINGNLLAVNDQFGSMTTSATGNPVYSAKVRTFVNDQAGHVLSKTESGVTQYYFYVGDKPAGSTGANGSADFDSNYTPVSDQYPVSTPSSYVVNPGDSLRTIASAVYGDAQLWYLIADANGLQPDEALPAGKSLRIPNKVTNVHNDFQTFKPYAPGGIIGDTTPTLPDPPPPPQDDDGFGFFDIFAIAVGVFISIVSGGGLIGALLGNLGTQVVNIASGRQSGFDFGSFGMAFISWGVTTGLTEFGFSTDIAKVGLPTAMVNTALGNIITQGIGVATGLQDKFSWSAVAGAAAGAAVGYGVTQAIGEAQYGGDWNSEAVESQNVQFDSVRQQAEWGNTLVRQAASGFISGAVRQLIGNGKVDWRNVAADAFGNALGNAVVNASTSSKSSLPPDSTEVSNSRLTPYSADSDIYGGVGISEPTGSFGVTSNNSTSRNTFRRDLTLADLDAPLQKDRAAEYRYGQEELADLGGKGATWSNRVARAKKGFEWLLEDIGTVAEGVKDRTLSVLKGDIPFLEITPKDTPERIFSRLAAKNRENGWFDTGLACVPAPFGSDINAASVSSGDPVRDNSLQYTLGRSTLEGGLLLAGDGLFRYTFAPVGRLADRLYEGAIGERAVLNNAFNAEFRLGANSSAPVIGNTPMFGVVDDLSLARSLVNDAKVAKFVVGRDISDLAAETGGIQAGLINEVKDVSSLAPKLARESYSVKSTNDVLRYSLLYPEESLGANTNKIMQALEDRGYEKIAVKNFFKESNRYLAINTTFATPEGQLFEIQFHTPQGYAINKSTHDMYDIARKLSEGDPARIILERKIASMAAEIRIPSGIRQTVPDFKR